MSKKDVTVTVEASPYDVLDHVSQIVVAVRAASKLPGGLPVQLPADITALITQLPSIIAEAPSIPADLAEDAGEFADGTYLGARKVLNAFRA